MGTVLNKAKARAMSEGEAGLKLDAGKLRYDLVDVGALRELVRVLGWGAWKYSPDNWKLVPDARARYYAAAMRHLEAWRAGEWENVERHAKDGEEREHRAPHLAHVLCCVMFLLAFGPEFSTVGWANDETPPASPRGGVDYEGSGSREREGARRRRRGRWARRRRRGCGRRSSSTSTRATRCGACARAWTRRAR
jgi:hypothetical protein